MADIIPGNAILKSIGADSLYGITIKQREVMSMFQVTTLIIFRASDKKFTVPLY